MNKFMYSPDATDVAANTTAVTNASPAPDVHTRHMENVPDKDAVLLSVSETVSDMWLKNPFITLLWQTQPDFQKIKDEFGKDLQSRNTAGGKRSQQSLAVDEVDKEIEDTFPMIKNMIGGKYLPADVTAYYPEFGFYHHNMHWDFPTDRQKRRQSLLMMRDAVGANGFGASKYGTDFWNDIITRYDAAVAAATTGAGDVSGGVSNLVTLRTTLRRVLHAILLLLEANYPYTFEQERRVWGFQKEKY